jgi:hypothetical protein
MKIHPVGAELFHADRYRDRQAEGKREREREGRRERQRDLMKKSIFLRFCERRLKRFVISWPKNKILHSGSYKVPDTSALFLPQYLVLLFNYRKSSHVRRQGMWKACLKLKIHTGQLSYV